MSSKKWTKRDPTAAPDAFAGELGVSGIIASLLWQRGLNTFELASEFLKPRLETLESPGVYTDMEKAVSRIRAAVAAREKIVIYGDYDVDGVTGSSITYLALKGIGADVEVFIPDRIQEGYGLKKSALERAVGRDTRLVITVDNGITGNREIDYLNSRKIDVIIVDHHEPKGAAPAALALITSERKSGGKESDLAACGLAFKLAWALSGSLEGAKEHLDLAALGTIADMAPLTGENRIIALHGLREMAKTKKTGLRALLSMLNLKTISGMDVAFQLAPRINAAGRLGSARDAFNLLVTDNAVEADNLVRVLDEGNKLRQKLEQDAFEEALKKVEAEHHFGRDRVIIVADEGWHEGIVGILATRLVERYHRPSFAISLREGMGKGSGRSIPSFYLFETMMECQSVFETFGGHRFACGLTIKEDRISDFRSAINGLAGSRLKPEDLVPSLVIDAEIPLGGLTEKFLAELEALEPFGTGNPRPLFLTRNLIVKNPARSLGKSGTSFWVGDEESGAAAEAVSFRRKFDFRKKETIDAVYTPCAREWGGIRSIQLRLEDAEVSREIEGGKGIGGGKGVMRKEEGAAEKRL